LHIERLRRWTTVRCARHQVKRDHWLASTSGGAEVCSGLVGGAIVLPGYGGELQCRLLGVKVEALDAAGAPLIDAAD
jgi:acetoacetyl-CoA synthetase